MIQFTKFTGTSPGTTTMEVPAMNGLGVCPPGYYGENIMLPGAVSFGPPPSGSSVIAVVNPYGTESKLAGRPLRGAVRWDVMLLGFGLAFAGVLGYALFKRKRR